MRTRFVIHKNLLSQVFRVRPRRYFHVNGKWHPEDILVENPKREGSIFILPKSEYVPCLSNGQPIQVQGSQNAEVTVLSASSTKQVGGRRVD